MTILRCSAHAEISALSAWTSRTLSRGVVCLRPKRWTPSCIRSAFSYQPIDACDPGTWRSMMSSNLDSAFYAYHFCREALRRHHGRLIFFGLAGVSTHRAEPNLSAYAAAKSGLMSLVSSIARVEAPFGVTCNVIAPGLLHDASAEAVSRFRIPARRTATEGELVGCVRYLLSDEAAQVTGTTLTLSGGWRL